MTEDTTTTEKTLATAAPEKKEEAKPFVKKEARGRGRRDRKKREPKEFEESIIQISRVTRVVKGGRRMRFRIAVVIGDKKGRVGFGVGKSSEVLGGIQKAVFAAKKNLMTISLDKKNDSIPHEIKGKYKASQVLLLPAPKGKGVVAGGAVRKILELAGVKNVLSKMHGSRNSLNSTRATLNALSLLANFKNPGDRTDIKEEVVSNDKEVDSKSVDENKSNKK